MDKFTDFSMIPNDLVMVTTWYYRVLLELGVFRNLLMSSNKIHIKN